jgi:hypothetical protein
VLATHIALTLLGGAAPWASPSTGGGVGQRIGAAAIPFGRRLAEAAAVARGCVPCPADAASPTSAAGSPPVSPGPASVCGIATTSARLVAADPVAATAAAATAAADAAADAVNGDGTCRLDFAAPAWAKGGALECYTGRPGPALPSPAPVWLWLWAAPLMFYLAWQLLYFLVVQVGCVLRAGLQ